MKTYRFIVAAVAASVLALGLVASPPSLVSASPVQGLRNVEFVGNAVPERNQAALSYLAGHSDEFLFAQSFRLRGRPVVVDEFTTSGAAENDEAMANREALRWAKRVLAGDALIPVRFDLQLLRYNPENKAFVLWTGAHVRDVEVDYRQVSLPSIKDTFLKTVRVLNLGVFEALRVEPDVAKELVEAAPGRRVTIYGLVRVRPGSAKVNKDWNTNSGMHEASLEGDIVRYQVGPSGRVDYFNPKVFAMPYLRTDREKQVGEQLGGRTYFSSVGSLSFESDGTCRSTTAGADEWDSRKEDALKRATLRKWYLIGSKILLQRMDGDREQEPGFWDFVILSPARIRVNNVLYVEEPKFSTRPASQDG